MKHEEAFNVFSTANCGVLEMANITTVLGGPQEITRLAARDISRVTFGFARKPPIVYYISVEGKVVNLGHASPNTGYGKELADYIVANGLGTITETPPVRNWTGNTIKMWFWHPDYDALRKLLYY